MNTEAEFKNELKELLRKYNVDKVLTVDEMLQYTLDSLNKTK